MPSLLTVPALLGVSHHKHCVTMFNASLHSCTKKYFNSIALFNRSVLDALLCPLSYTKRAKFSKNCSNWPDKIEFRYIMCEFFPSIENMQLRFLSFPFCPTSCSSSNNAHLTGILHLTNISHLTIFHLPIPHRFYLDPLARTETICWGTKVLKLSDGILSPF